MMDTNRLYCPRSLSIWKAYIQCLVVDVGKTLPTSLTKSLRKFLHSSWTFLLAYRMRKLCPTLYIVSYSFVGLYLRRVCRLYTLERSRSVNVVVYR